MKTTREILESVRDKLERNALSDTAQLKREIKSHVTRILQSPTERNEFLVKPTAATSLA